MSTLLLPLFSLLGSIANGCDRPTLADLSSLPDHTAPLNLKNIWTWVSSKNESPPQTHFVEFPQSNDCFRGYAYGTEVWINLNRNRDSTAMTETLVHEYAHAWAAMTWQTTDPWVEEGLAHALAYDYCLEHHLVCEDSQAKLGRVFDSFGGTLFEQNVANLEDASTAFGFIYWLFTSFDKKRWVSNLALSRHLNADSLWDSIPAYLKKAYRVLADANQSFFIGHYRLTFARSGKTLFRRNSLWEFALRQFGSTRVPNDSKDPLYWAEECDPQIPEGYQTIPKTSPIFSADEAVLGRCLMVRLTP